MIIEGLVLHNYLEHLQVIDFRKETEPKWHSMNNLCYRQEDSRTKVCYL